MRRTRHRTKAKPKSPSSKIPIQQSHQSLHHITVRHGGGYHTNTVSADNFHRSRSVTPGTSTKARGRATLERRHFRSFGSRASDTDEEIIPMDPQAYQQQRFRDDQKAQNWNADLVPGQYRSPDPYMPKSDLPVMSFPDSFESVDDRVVTKNPAAKRKALPNQVNVMQLDEHGVVVHAERMHLQTSIVDPHNDHIEFNLQHRFTPKYAKSPQPFDEKIKTSPPSPFIEARQQRERDGILDLPERMQAQRRACRIPSDRLTLDLQHITTHCRTGSFYEATVVLFDAIRDRLITQDHVLMFFIESLKVLESQTNPSLRQTYVYRVKGATSTLLASLVTFTTLNGPFLLTNRTKNAIAHTLIAADAVDLLETFYRALLYCYLHQIRQFSSQKDDNSLAEAHKEATEFLHYFEGLEDHYDCGDFEDRLQKKIPDHVVLPFIKRFVPGHKPFPTRSVPQHLFEAYVTPDLINKFIACAAKNGHDHTVHAWLTQLTLNGDTTTADVDHLLLSTSATYLSKLTSISTSMLFSSSFVAPTIETSIHSPFPRNTPTMPTLPFSSLISDLNFHCLRARDILDRSIEHNQSSTSALQTTNLLSALQLNRYLQVLAKSIIPPSFADTYYGQDQIAEIIASESLGSRIDHAFDIVLSTPRANELIHSRAEAELPLDHHPGVISIYDWPWRHHRTIKENPGLDSRFNQAWDRISPHDGVPLHERPRYLSLENYIDAVLPHSVEGKTRRKILQHRNNGLLLSMLATTVGYFEHEANKQKTTSFLSSSSSSHDSSLFNSTVSTQILNSLVEALLRCDHPTIALALVSHSKENGSDVTVWVKWLRQQFLQLKQQVGETTGTTPSTQLPEFQPVAVDNIMDISEKQLHQAYPFFGFVPRRMFPALNLMGTHRGTPAKGKSPSSSSGSKQTKHVFLRPSFQSYELLASYAITQQDVPLAYTIHTQLFASNLFETDSSSLTPSKLTTLTSNIALTLLRGPLATIVSTNRDDFICYPNDAWPSMDPDLASVIPSQSMMRLKDQLSMVYQAYSMIITANPFQYGKQVVSPSLQITLLALAAYTGDITSCIRIIYSIDAMRTLPYCIQWIPYLLITAYSQGLFIRNAESFQRLEIEDQTLYSLGDHAHGLLSLREAITPLVESLVVSDLDPAWQISHLPDGLFDHDYYNRIQTDQASGKLQGFRTALRELARRFGSKVPNWDDLIQFSRRELNVLTHSLKKSSENEGHVAFLPPPSTLVRGIPALFEFSRLSHRQDGLFIDIIPNKSSSQWFTTQNEQHADLKRTIRTLLYSKDTIKKAIDSFSKIYYRSFLPYFLQLSRPITNSDPMRLSYSPRTGRQQEYLDTCLNDIIQIYHASLQQIAVLYGDKAQPMPVLPTLFQLRPPGVTEDVLSRFILMLSNTQIGPLEQGARVGHILTEEAKQERIAPFQPDTLSVFPKNVLSGQYSTHISTMSLDDLLTSMNVEVQSMLLIQSASVHAILRQPQQCRNILMNILHNRQQYTLHDKSLFTFPLSSLVTLLARITIAAPFYSYVQVNADILTPRKAQSPIEYTYSRLFKAAEQYLAYRGNGNIPLEQAYCQAIAIAQTDPTNITHVIKTGSDIIFDIFTQYGLNDEPKYSIIAFFYSRYLVAMNSADGLQEHDQISRIAIASMKTSGLVDDDVDPNLAVESSRVALKRTSLGSNLSRLVTSDELDGLQLIVDAMHVPTEEDMIPLM